jgi:hypothetical protein
VSILAVVGGERKHRESRDGRSRNLGEQCSSTAGSSDESQRSDVTLSYQSTVADYRQADDTESGQLRDTKPHAVRYAAGMSVQAGSSWDD